MHVVLIGAPGKAKSAIARRLADLVGLRFFKYQLNRYTEPSELIGPLDIAALREGRYVRITRGKLPEAEIAFLDEVFKANSATLNALLSLMQERVWYDGYTEVKARLIMVVGASNEVPVEDELRAFYDRFALRVFYGEQQEFLEKEEWARAIARNVWSEYLDLLSRLNGQPGVSTGDASNSNGQSGKSAEQPGGQSIMSREAFVEEARRFAEWAQQHVDNVALRVREGVRIVQQKLDIRVSNRRLGQLVRAALAWHWIFRGPDKKPDNRCVFHALVLGLSSTLEEQKQVEQVLRESGFLVGDVSKYLEQAEKLLSEARAPFKPRCRARLPRRHV